MASPARADLDFTLKLQTAAAFAASGYSCKVNVALSAVGDGGLADVTDVDVLAIGRDVTFAPHIVCVSCKAGSNLSVAKELFYLRGVLDYVRGDEGILLVGGRRIDPHLRELASTLSLLPLAQNEIAGWQASLMNGRHDPGYFSDALFDEYDRAIRAIPPSAGLSPFLKAEYWFYRDFRNVQNLLAHLRKYAPSLDGRSRLHTTQFLDVAWHFSQTVLDLCGHVRRAGIDRLVESVSAYLFGGRPTYKARKDLLGQVGQILTTTGVAKPGALPQLEPEYTTSLAEIVVRFLERPHSAIEVPLVLQDVLWRDLGAIGAGETETKNRLAAFKLSQDLIDFMKKAVDARWAPTID